MTRKFKSGDRVRVKPTSVWSSYYFTCGVDCVGTVIGYDDGGFILVKFDNLTNGHSGLGFYRNKGITYDPKNRQHLYVFEENLEREEHDN